MPSNEFLALTVGQLWQVTILCVVAKWASKTLLKNQPTLAYQMWMLVMLKSVTPPIWASHCGVFTWLFQGLTAASVSVLQLGFGSSITPQQVAFSLVLLWVVGIALSLVKVRANWISIRNKITETTTAMPPGLQRGTSALATRLGIRCKVRFVLTSQPIGPAVIGYWNPLIVLPQEIVAGKSFSEVEPLIAHELLHVKRGDTLVAQLETLVRAVWWFHPSVQRAADALSQAGELCCDQDVLNLLACEPRRYADALIEVIESRSRLQPLAGQPGIRQEQITRDRLKRIMTRKESHLRWPLRIGFLWLGMLLILPGRSLG